MRLGGEVDFATGVEDHGGVVEVDECIASLTRACDPRIFSGKSEALVLGMLGLEVGLAPMECRSGHC